MFGIEFRTKNSWAHMSISPRSGARGSKDQYIWNLKMYRNGKLDSLLGSTLAKIRINQNNFYLNLFLIWFIFLAALSPKLNVFSHFSTKKYFNRINLSSPLALLWGEIDIPARWLFYTKVNSKQLFSIFFDISHIFGTVEP